MADSQSGKTPVPSPCISICALNDEDVCVGCYRTANEIRDWITLSDNQKREVIQRALGREKRYNPFI